MSKNLTITIIGFSVILLLIVICLLKKDKIPVKYALVWIAAVLFMLIVSLIPNLMWNLANLLGFELLSNMVLCVFIAILLFITLTLTIMCANQKKRLTLVIQELSILKEKVNKK